MKVRQATQADAKDIAQVQVDTWRTTYKNIVPDDYLKQMTYESREQIWQQIMTVHPVFVAETETGKIVGFANGSTERTGNYPDYQGELYAIYILESYQKRGLGKKLPKPVIEVLIQQNISSLIVLVLEANDARLFYEALGAEMIDVLDIQMLGRPLRECVYGWPDIHKVQTML